jgi:hypothetical protein
MPWGVDVGQVNHELSLWRNTYIKVKNFLLRKEEEMIKKGRMLRNQLEKGELLAVPSIGTPDHA